MSRPEPWSPRASSGAPTLVRPAAAMYRGEGPLAALGSSRLCETAGTISFLIAVMMQHASRSQGPLPSMAPSQRP